MDLATIFLLIFALGNVSGVTETPSPVIGFIDGRLELVCNSEKQLDQGVIISRFLSEKSLKKPQNLKEFVSTKWNKTTNGLAKVCVHEHRLFHICSSQVTVYPTSNHRAHFVFVRTPTDLHGLETVCSYPTTISQDPGPRQVIKLLQGKIEGYVGGKTVIECPIPYRGCNDSKRISLKFNDTFVQRASITRGKQPTTNFVCVNETSNGRYHDVCNGHMNLSHLNNSCSVIFVIENTTASVNNTYVHCHVHFDDVNKRNNHTDYARVILLHRNDSSLTVAPTPFPDTPGTTLPGTTTSTVPIANTTTSTNESTASQEENGLGSGGKAGIVIGAVVAVVAVVAVPVIVICCKRSKKFCCKSQPNQGASDGAEFHMTDPQN